MTGSSIPDRIKCNTDWNVYSGCGDRLHALSPGGIPLGRIKLEGGVANFCFSWPGEVFLLNKKKLWRAQILLGARSALLRLPYCHPPGGEQRIKELEGSVWRRRDRLYDEIYSMKHFLMCNCARCASQLRDVGKLEMVNQRSRVERAGPRLGVAMPLYDVQQPNVKHAQTHPLPQGVEENSCL